MRSTLRDFPFDGTGLPLLLLLASGALAVWPAHDRHAAWAALVPLAGGVALSLAVSRLRGGERAWRVAAGAAVAAGVVLSWYFATHYHHLAYPEKIPSIDRLAGWLGLLALGATSWAPDRNSVGTALGGLLFLAVGLAVVARSRAARLVWSAATSVLAAGVVLSASRGAWFGVAVAAAVWAAIRWPPLSAKPGLVPLAAALPLVAGLAWLAAVVWWPDATGSGGLTAALDRPDRVALYRESAFLIGDYPFTGVGLGGQFVMLLSRYVLLIQVPFLTYSHNLYLETWLQLGLPGMLALAWLVTAFIGSLDVLPQLRQRLLAEATAMGLLATLLHGLVDARQYVDAWTSLPIFLLLGLHTALMAPAETAPLRRRSCLWTAVVVTALLISVGATNWPLGAAWQANLGAVRQGQSELGPRARSASTRAGGTALAEGHFRAALAAAPGQRTANFRMALIEMADGRYDAAAGHAAVAWAAHPESVATRKGLGLALVWVGDLERARPLLAGLPGIVDELNTWGAWRAGRRETPIALRAYLMSLELDPSQEHVRDAVAQLRRVYEPRTPAGK